MQEITTQVEILQSMFEGVGAIEANFEPLSKLNDSLQALNYELALTAMINIGLASLVKTGVTIPEVGLSYRPKYSEKPMIFKRSEGVAEDQKPTDINEFAVSLGFSQTSGEVK